MPLRVTFVAAARSSPLLAERFEDDRPLDQAGWGEVERAAQELLPLAAAELRYCSPTPRSRATGRGSGTRRWCNSPCGTAAWAGGAG